MANNTFSKQPLNLQSPICMDENDGVLGYYKAKNGNFYKMFRRAIVTSEYR